MSILLLIAGVLLFLAAFGVTLGRVNPGWLGLAIWCLALLNPFTIVASGPVYHRGFDGWWILVLLLLILAVTIWWVTRGRFRRGKPPLNTVLSR